MQVVMIGTGYVGLVSGTCFAEVGHNVTCVDIDQKKIQQLKDGISPIYEPGLEQLLHRNIEHGRLSFTTHLVEAMPGAEVIFIAVGTPEGEDGSADLKYVQAAASLIGQHLSRETLVVVKSTVPVGTCDMVEQTIREELGKRHVNVKFTVGSNPEFLKEGDAINDCMKPDRIVVGVNDRWSEEIFRELYSPFIIVDPSRLMVMQRRSSELTKYASNSMLATRISFMNELSRLCEKLGANIDDIRRGMGADPRIGQKFLYAGPGYGGSCFPKDVVALLKTAEKHDEKMTILTAVEEANDNQKVWVANKIKKHFGGDVRGKRIAVWGLAFKPKTDDVREAPALTIIEKLIQWGATVVAHDPEAMETFKRCHGSKLDIEYVKSAYNALQGADALVLVTEWSEYRRPSWDRVKTMMRGNAIFDFRNQYIGQHLTEKGFVRIGVGV